ncbi:4-amino-4-deoxychorismate lyase [Thermotomaculum hydrothermale]|uniref:branched-chain-amino-acid transaminase n=1 Tax=Thermotomaculum hydrothermale TaxID=981385 RepID=A0A7R6PIF5_9BACT|nr:aminotransferase class IV [Thermotomaculum hydrothermale]BBB33189.1 4-amino-4-deoxychorismate lyase [Thermotomaculum hydrothermale]
MKILEFLNGIPNTEDFGIFETIKVYNEKPLRLKLHYSRMKKSAEELDIGFIPSYGEFVRHIDNLNLNNKNYLKIIATKRGIFTESGIREIPDKKVKLVLIKDRFVYSKNTYLLHKTTDYRFLKEITELAKKRNCYDGIILNEKGNVTQTGKCNIYFEKQNGEIVTPPLSEGLLPGTIRQIAIKRKLVKEDIIPEKDIKNFKKCFVSNALIGILEADIIF